MSLNWEIQLGNFLFETGPEGYIPEITSLLLAEDLILDNSGGIVYKIPKNEFIRRLESIGYNKNNIQISIDIYKKEILNKRDSIMFSDKEFLLYSPDDYFWENIKSINYEVLSEYLYSYFRNIDIEYLDYTIALFRNEGFERVIEPYFDPLILYFMFANDYLLDEEKVIVNFSSMKDSETWSGFGFNSNHFDETISKYNPETLRLNQYYFTEENLKTEFKSISGSILNSIKKNLKKYAIGFLNSEGGEIIWGIEDDGRISGFEIDSNLRDCIRKDIYSILGSIIPSVELNTIKIVFIDLISNGRVLNNRQCLKVDVKKGNVHEMYYSESGNTWIKLEGILKELKGYDLFKYIIRKYK